MRIIAGKWRGRKLFAPVSNRTRPTTDRVREALFSMLASRLGSLEGLQVADIFAGSGALGLEALSRGAAHCDFVEQDSRALQLLRSNISQLGASAAVIRGSAERVSRADQVKDLIVMDPPYGKGLIEPVLKRLNEQGWLAPGCWVSVETETSIAVEVSGLTVDTTRRFSKARITLLKASAQ